MVAVVVALQVITPVVPGRVEMELAQRVLRGKPLLAVQVVAAVVVVVEQLPAVANTLVVVAVVEPAYTEPELKAQVALLTIPVREVAAVQPEP
jgi:hypothetical protein